MLVAYNNKYIYDIYKSNSIYRRIALKPNLQTILLRLKLLHVYKYHRIPIGHKKIYFCVSVLKICSFWKKSGPTITPNDITDILTWHLTGPTKAWLFFLYRHISIQTAEHIAFVLNKNEWKNYCYIEFLWFFSTFF